MIRFSLAVLAAILFSSLPLSAEEIGSVDTVFKLLGANHKIVVEAFDDPKVPGVACHLSRAKTGGIKGSLGIAEDTADASIACRQVGPIAVSRDPKTAKTVSKFTAGGKEQQEALNEGEEVFTKSTSLIFKSMQVVRFYDGKRNVLVYLVYSDRVIEGSPKNSLSSVPIMKWE